MPGSGREIAAALRAFPGQASGDLQALEALIADALGLDPSGELDRALFGIFERFPEEDGGGVYWSIVHGLEGRGGYEAGLLESVRRAPSPFALIMLSRIYNDGQADCAGVSITSVLAEVAASPKASEEVRRQAVELLEERRDPGESGAQR